MNKNPKVMLHLILPDQISGPNNATKRIFESYLNEKYTFGLLSQNYHAGGKINVKLIFDLYNQIKNFNPDLIHINGLQASGFHAAIAAKLACKPLVMTIRGSSIDSLGISNMKRIAYGKIMEPLTLSLCDKYYTVCKAMENRKELEKYHWKCAGTIYNAAPQISLNKEAERIKYRKQLGISEDEIAIVISGRMTEDKGILDIITVIKSLYKKRENKIKFVFIGDGPCLRDLEITKGELKTSNLLLLGKRTDVINILCACDIFLFATLHENLSNALLEAMTIGLPIVATDVGGNPEVVEDEKNGFLVSAHSPNEIEEKLLILKENSSLRNQFALRSMEIINEKFLQSDIYAMIDNLYTSMIHGK